MAVAIPNLWPPDIRVDVLTPVAVLKAQIQHLEQMTKGLLRVELSTRTQRFESMLMAGYVTTPAIPGYEDSTEIGTTHVFHDMDLVAPSLRNYRHTLLTVQYLQDRVYPARISSKLHSGGIEAESAEEFIAMLGEVLQSPSTRSLIESLLARINEQSIDGL